MTAAPTDPPAKPTLVQMNVRVPAELRDRIDERRKVKGLSRDKWVANALRYALDNTPATRPMTTRPGQQTAAPPQRRPR